MTNINQLPNEIIVIIFSYLDWKDILNVSEVSKTFYNLSFENKPKICLRGKKYIKWIDYLCERFEVHLDLSDTDITDVSALGRVHTLDLSHTDVKDVSALGRVHKLNLRNTSVKDVSALGGVHTLNLCWSNVIDVSALSQVNTLDLWCTMVTDVSMLINVKTLYLCKKHLDVSKLVNTRIIYI